MWKWFLPLLLCAGMAGAAAAKPANPYEIIEKQPQADALMREVVTTMGSQFGLRLRRPIELHLVEAQEMDKLLDDSPYKGAEIGLYTGVANGKHQVYVMRGWGRNLCAGITAHELTHAWQEENAPPTQSQVLKEGFARWVEYKYYDVTGAYAYAERIRETADPVYGVGFQKIFDLEDSVGAQRVAETMRRAVGVQDLPAKTK